MDAETINRNTSIRALRSQTESLISALLNPLKRIPSENGLPRDRRGLASLCGIGGQFEPQIASSRNPTKTILTMWIENDPENSTIDKLISFLEDLDRFDIVADITELIDEDIKQFQANPSAKVPVVPNLEGDKYILTSDDVSRLNKGLAPQNYHAFVLFADDDIDFATELIDTMEKQYNMRFCIKDRDLVGGGFEHDVIIKLIIERCDRLVVILSDSFINSPANNFFMSFAQSYSIAQCQRKVIPCLYKKCNLPLHLSGYFLLDYTRARHWNFWDKLRDAIITAPSDIDKLALNRSNSENNQSVGKSLMRQEKVALNNVKFHSTGNLNNSDKEIKIEETPITASTSVNSLEILPPSDQKPKKVHWLKKILTRKRDDAMKDVLKTEKATRKSNKESKHVKRKTAVIAN